MTELSLMDKFADPALMQSMTMGEKLTGAGVTTLMGMGITFAVLILLWGVIALITKAFRAFDAKTAAQAAPAAPVAASTPSAAPIAQAANDDALVAVISAAIAAFEGAGATNNLVVRKITRISGPDTTWSVAGHADCAESRRF